MLRPEDRTNGGGTATGHGGSSAQPREPIGAALDRVAPGKEIAMNRMHNNSTLRFGLAATIAISALLPSAGRASESGTCYRAPVPHVVAAPDGAKALRSVGACVDRSFTPNRRFVRVYVDDRPVGTFLGDVRRLESVVEDDAALFNFRRDGHGGWILEGVSVAGGEGSFLFRLAPPAVDGFSAAQDEDSESFVIAAHRTGNGR
jgi:hypothetical protein